MPNSADIIEQHLELPLEEELHQGIVDHYVDGFRLPRGGLSAARLQGDSMVDRKIFDGDAVIFEHSEFYYAENGRIVVIERHGDEEGMGAWSLKSLIQRPLSRRNEQDDEIGSENLSVTLRSHNRKIMPWSLDPSGQYVVRGVLRQSVRPRDVRLVDTEMLQAVMAEELL